MPDVYADPQQNARALRDKVATAFANNQAFLANGSPSNADAIAQLRALTRQMNGLARLLFAQVDDITDS